jgi:[acyl-carrier-protein] S-malonyltransferase
MAKTLNVAGAYHSRLMNSAFLSLGEVLQATPIQTPRFAVICNVDAQPVSEGEEIRQSLQDQVTGTVRWTETIEHLVDEEKCDLFLELGPGGVLAGLLNRTRKGTPCYSITDVATLDAAVAALRAL